MKKVKMYIFDICTLLHALINNQFDYTCNLSRSQLVIEESSLSNKV